jgi:hypothetical protein
VLAFGQAAAEAAPDPTPAVDVVAWPRPATMTSLAQTADGLLWFGTLLELQIELLVMAFACDRTRVASLMLGATGGGTAEYAYTWLGLTKEQHQLSHEPDGSAGQEQFVRALIWETRQFAMLLDRMKQVIEPDGTLLDSSLVMWGNELGKGNTHTGHDIPYVLAGRCQGRLKTGRYLKFDGRPSHSELYVPLLNALGVPATTFGDPDFYKRPLPGVFA